MMKSILVALTLAIGLSAAAGGAAAGVYDTGIYANLPEWQVKALVNPSND